MKWFKRILPCALAALLLAAAVLCATQWDNLTALYRSFTHTAQEILGDMESHRQDLQSALEKHHVTLAPPSVQQNEALLNGEADPQEVKESLGLDDPDAPLSLEDFEGESADLLTTCVADLYGYQIDLMAQLGSMKQEVVDYWNSLHPSQQDPALLHSMGLEGLSKCFDLEVEADRQVQAILEEYRPQLEALGEDTAILDQLWRYYCDAKASQKAYYLKKYLN